ncbi:SpoIIE family protein phosphatase [Streptomyces sp. NPDC056161]|uniref:SpoIIE family protein phosphatase n=1 Tax=Streptomyces sp. NPDC056161 TaxID=3345732 RepID=UPI0035DAD8DD
MRNSLAHQTERAELASFGAAATWDVDRWAAETETLALAVRHVTAFLGGLGGLVYRWDPGSARLYLMTVEGLAPGATEAWAELRGEQDVVPARALRSGHFTWVGDDSLGIGASGAAAVPILGAEGPMGVLCVLTAASGEPDELQRSILGSVAAWTAAHLEGVLGTPPGIDEVASAERTVRMGELTAALAEALTSHDVVEAVADYVMPPFGADGLIVYSLEGGRVYVVGSTGYPKEYLDMVLHGLPLTEHAPAPDVLRAGTPLFVETRAECRRLWPTWRGSRLSPMEAWVFLPLIASGRSIGVCVVAFRRPRSFRDKQERALLTALSGLIGQALERARLYDVEHARAQELQRGLLPRELPSLPAVCAAARYLPAGRGEEAGGDWYDVIPLSADRVALVIGDVMGHGITEAATMGRLRTAVRTLADLDMPADELLGHLNDLVSDLGEDFYATCLYAIFDPVTRTCSFSLAGHPPPLVVRPDGEVHTAQTVPDPPLGAAAPPFALHELCLPEESLLVLYTDGLVESASRDFGQGVAQLRQTLASAAAQFPYARPGDVRDEPRRLEALCDTVISALVPDHERTTDDAALLIAHTRGTCADRIAVCNLPDSPQAAGQARAYVREQLDGWGLDDLVMTTELLVSELVGNVIRHAKGPIRLRLMYSRSLICEVYDGSLTTPRIRKATYTDEGGRGLQLISAVSLRWGARYLHDGKCIWAEQDIPSWAA